MKSEQDIIISQEDIDKMVFICKDLIHYIVIKNIFMDLGYIRNSLKDFVDVLKKYESPDSKKCADLLRKIEELPKLPPGFKRGKSEKKPRGQKSLQRKIQLLDPNPDEIIDITPNLEKYENDPNWKEVEIKRHQVVDIKIVKNVKELVLRVFRKKNLTD
ncbi:MAG: hypothetical protein LBF22_05865 [Deltaproteobacteria bacterium]|jgi:hypothetical protein|nr:hypothetical protein [Deltaproteobacteria bacterium]